MIRSSLAFAAIAVLVPVAFAGKVRVVATTGAPYVRVQDAINEAEKGDVILVKSAAQNSIRIADKWLAVVADNNVTIQQSGAVRVSNSKPGALVVLSGINCQGTYEANVPDVGHGFVAQNNFGQIFVQDCTFAGFNNAGTACLVPSNGAIVSNSNGIAFTRSTLTGASLTWIWTLYPPFPGSQGGGLSAINSTVSLASVQATAGGGGVTCNSGYPDGASGGTGITLVNSGLVASGSTARGGHGGNSQTGPPFGFCLPLGVGGAGGHGIYVQSSTAQLLSTAAFGGGGGMGCGIMLGGASGLPVYGTATTIPGTVRSLNGPRIVRDLSPAVFTFSGAPGETVEIAVSTNQAVHTVDVTQKGVLHVLNPRWRSVGVVPASGTLSASYKLPNLPLSDPGAIFIVQARFTAAGQSQLSNPHVLIEVDATY